MKFQKWRGGREAVLRPSRALLCGTGLAGVLFGSLMLPSYGAGDLASHGIPAWQVVALAGAANLAVAVSGFVLAMTGWQPRWPWVAGGMAVAGVGLVVPLFLPVASRGFVLLAALALFVYGLGAGLGQLAEQTSAVASVAKDRRSAAVGRIMAAHLPVGMVIGGLPLLLSWRAGQAVLAVVFLSLAGAVAVRRRTPEPYTRERYGLRRLAAETGSGSVIVATGQVAWVVMYLLPGLLEMPAWVIAMYAVAAQGVAAAALWLFSAVADRNRRRAALISGVALLLAILGVAIVPAIVTNGAGVWIGLAFFVAGEVSANFFITAIEGLISVEIGGYRAQLMGHVSKFTAVGLAGTTVALLSGYLAVRLGSGNGAIVLGGIIVVALSAMFTVSFSALSARHRRDGQSRIA